MLLGASEELCSIDWESLAGSCVCYNDLSYQLTGFDFIELDVVQNNFYYYICIIKVYKLYTKYTKL